MKLGDLADTSYSDLGIPIGATPGEPLVTDYGQADLRPFAMGAIAQQRDYQPTDARGTDLWGYQMGGRVVPPSEIDKAINMVMATSGGGLATKGIKAYHSSPHDFDKFDLAKIGTGEGAQVYGHGLYFAENPAVSGQGGQYWNQFQSRFDGPEYLASGKLKQAGFDRDAAAALSQKDVEALTEALKTGGHPAGLQGGPFDEHTLRSITKNMLYDRQAELDLLRGNNPVGPRTYEVNIKADPAQMLDWDKPLREQSGAVQDVAFGAVPRLRDAARPTGESFYDIFGRSLSDESRGRGRALASDRLSEAGIPGIKYLDEGSRNMYGPFQGAIDNHGSREAALANAQKRLASGFGDQEHYTKMIEALSKPQTSNYVVFDPSIIDIMKKYGIVGAAPTGMGALAARDYYKQE